MTKQEKTLCVTVACITATILLSDNNVPAIINWVDKVTKWAEEFEKLHVSDNKYHWEKSDTDYESAIYKFTMQKLKEENL